ncbi:MAG: GNAT family N-acetyltransferase [Planctomycetota bacterium]|jgi:RimJ/RimL family protein N-acetyltransferase
MSHDLLPFDWGSTLPELHAQDIDLRWVVPADAEDLFAVFGDPDVMRYWSHPAWTGLLEAKTYIASIHRHFSDRTLFQWGISDRSTGRLLGTCTLFQLDAQNRRGELGIILGKSAWGRGLGRQALETLVGFAFNSLGLHRLEADVDPKNRRSLALFEGQGFLKEGLLRERWFVHGQIQDTILLGLLAREWPGPRRSH